jgi:hypothetical protein
MLNDGSLSLFIVDPKTRIELFPPEDPTVLVDS